MVYKLPRIQVIPSTGTRLCKTAAVFGLVACCAVSLAFAGETAGADPLDRATSVTMMNDAIGAQMRVLQSTLENTRHIDAQTTRLDELIRLQTQQNKVLEKISDDLRLLVQLQIGRLQQDTQSSSTKAKGH